jgi:hypothetical protein
VNGQQSIAFQVGIVVVAILLDASFLFYADGKWSRAKTIAGKTMRRLADVRGGFVAVHGRVVPIATLTTPHSHKPAVYYRYKIEELRERLVRSSSRSTFGGTRTERYWATIDSGERRTDFLIDDGTAQARVQPDGAEFVLREDIVRAADGPAATTFLGGLITGSGERRYSETFLSPGDAVLVIGDGRPDHGHGAPGGGHPIVIHHEKPGSFFLVSDKPRDELISGFRSAALLSWAAAAAVTIAAICGVLYLRMNASGVLR